MALSKGGKKNNCKFCDCSMCQGGNDKGKCLIFNPSKPIPIDASPGERNYVAVNRAYVAAFEPDTLKGVKYSTTVDKVRELQNQKETQKKLTQGSSVNHIGYNDFDPAAISNDATFARWWADMENRRTVSVIAPFELPTVTIIDDSFKPIPDEGGNVEEGGPFASAVPVALGVKDFPLAVEDCVNMVSPLRTLRGTLTQLRDPETPSIPSPSIVSSPPVASPPLPAPTKGINFGDLIHRLTLLRTWLLTHASRMDSESSFKLAFYMILLSKLRGFVTRPLLARYGRLRAHLLLLAHRLINGLATIGTRLALFAGATSRTLPHS